MKTTKLYLTLLLVSAALFMYSCESVTNSVPQDEEILTQGMELSGSSKTKVDVCHYDAETDAYQLITIADPAVDAHINHGDAQPGDAVPTMEGFEFDDTCTPQRIIVDEITACFATVLADYREYHAGQNGETLLVDGDNTEGWIEGLQPQNGYTIVTLFDHILDAYGNGGLTLSAYENNSGTFCSIEISDPTSFFPGSTAPTDNLTNDIRYLEYLFAENPCNPLPNSFACQN